MRQFVAFILLLIVLACESSLHEEKIELKSTQKGSEGFEVFTGDLLDHNYRNHIVGQATLEGSEDGWGISLLKVRYSAIRGTEESLEIINKAIVGKLYEVYSNKAGKKVSSEPFKVFEPNHLAAEDNFLEYNTSNSIEFVWYGNWLLEQTTEIYIKLFDAKNNVVAEGLLEKKTVETSIYPEKEIELEFDWEWMLENDSLKTIPWGFIFPENDSLVRRQDQFKLWEENKETKDLLEKLNKGEISGFGIDAQGKLHIYKKGELPKFDADYWVKELMEKRKMEEAVLGPLLKELKKLLKTPKGE